MPRKTVPCSACEKPLKSGYRSTFGPPFCHDCRRAGWGWRRVRSTSCCERCGARFLARLVDGQPKRFCSLACYGVAEGARRRALRGEGDRATWRRNDRERMAVGLRKQALRRLLRKWKRQHRSCVYCDRPATTIDHVVPLIRGGTNFEGNLVPACRPCNSSKQDRTVLEFRLGRPRALTGMELRVRPPTAAKPIRGEQLVMNVCPICGVLYEHRRRYCSSECMWEGNRIRSRERYVRRSPTVKPCEDCATVSVTFPRKKCDDCVRATRRAAKRRYKLRRRHAVEGVRELREAAPAA